MDNMDKQPKSHMIRAFEIFARTAIKNAAIDYDRAREKNSNLISLSDLWEGQVDDKLQASDTYNHETCFEYPILGKVAYISDVKLAEALDSLTKEERDIILMYYFLKMKDKNISDKLGINRRTFNANRLAIFEKLKKIYLLKVLEDEKV